MTAILAALAALAIADDGPNRGQAPAPAVVLVDRPPDPHGSPRPARGARDVPLKTSLYVELALPRGVDGTVDPRSVEVELRRQGGQPVRLLSAGSVFAAGAQGWLRTHQDLGGNRSLAVYIEPGFALEAATTYTASVSAAGSKTPATRSSASWDFTTEAAPSRHELAFPLDLKAEPVRWHGRFFSGICNVIFSSQAASYGPTYDLMARARAGHPRAWSYQRDFWPTGTDFRPPGLLPQNLPNIVRERETRRIAAIEPQEKATRLRLEDVFGNDQYGIPAGRPVADDYHPGDEVLVADGVNDAKVKVVAADNATRTVTVTPLPTPPGGWKLAYERPLPTREDPDAPGLFPPGGCYLRKFRPNGTPCYYWGRLDKEWDLAVKTYGRRVLVNLADATGDLARDGRSWTTAKDLAEWHEVVRAIAGHVIDRYGERALTLPWSVFNEPDLGPLFWRTDWDELQRFYDYTTDAVLRAFEDRGYDSDRVFIGGLELGGIFGVNLRLREFLAHCSPRAKAQGALPLNAAFADRALDGRRSRRVEALCRAHAGKGAPCDFVSVHSYNRSELMAAKLVRAKELALEIDPDYYRALWVNSHESCPDWLPPPDEAAVDAYLGDGYFATWCLDVVDRQLARASADPRYAYGETILTVWPPPANFAGINAVTRNVSVDDDRNGTTDRMVTVPMPIFHVLGRLSDLGDSYWPLPARTVGGHRVGGFASRDEKGVLRIVVFSHHAQDTQSRSDASFLLTLDVTGLAGTGPLRVTEYRFDRDHNSPFRLAREVRDHPSKREPGRAAAGGFFAPPPAYAKADVERLQAATAERASDPRTIACDADGRLRVPVTLAGNGCVFLTVAPEENAVKTPAGRP